MSFIRAGEQGSDVYVYPGEYSSGLEYFQCCERFDTKGEMFDHLVEHRAAGECVPDVTFARLAEWDRVQLGFEAMMRAGR